VIPNIIANAGGSRLMDRRAAAWAAPHRPWILQRFYPPRSQRPLAAALNRFLTSPSSRSQSPPNAVRQRAKRLRPTSTAQQWTSIETKQLRPTKWGQQRASSLGRFLAYRRNGREYENWPLRNLAV